MRRLTNRQIEVIKQVCDGKSNREIAANLHISDKTVATHRSNVMRKLEINCVALLVRWAIREGHVQAAGYRKIVGHA